MSHYVRHSLHSVHQHFSNNSTQSSDPADAYVSSPSSASEECVAEGDWEKSLYFSNVQKYYCRSAKLKKKKFLPENQRKC